MTPFPTSLDLGLEAHFLYVNPDSAKQLEWTFEVDSQKSNSAISRVYFI